MGNLDYYLVVMLPIYNILQDGDDFTKTDCFHYFHVTCLARYYQFFTRKQEPEATPTSEPRPHKPMVN